ncbi:Serine protease S53 [Mycena venus]|uniref:Serine protease S53 n=1 Tax=Mycena venus TaxID=2733690 RepID=A0A8H6XKU6_9AGAR|nr:Serine protease S53 [Mycena venus]
MLARLTILSVILSAVNAEFLVLEKRENPPDGFLLVGAPPSDKVLNLRLSLTQNDISGLHDTIHEVSTPGNPLVWLKTFVAPAQDTLAQVNSWFASNNLTASPVTAAGDWIAVNMTVSQANDLLAADFSTFQNKAMNTTVVRTLSYSIPGELKGHIVSVDPTVNFPVRKKSVAPLKNRAFGISATRAPAARSVSTDCHASSQWTPSCVQQLYGIPSAPAKAVANVLGVSGFGNAFSNHRDLKQYLETYLPNINPNTTYSFISIDDGVDNQLPLDTSSEADLNIQTTIGLATGVQVAFLGTGPPENSNDFSDYLDEANFILGMEQPPQTVLNTFAGFNSENSFQAPAMISLCNAYAQLAARGISYIVSTGESFFDCEAFEAPFPASCPFVTAVGGSEFNVDETQETAFTFGGGGFSTLFQRPTYQDAAVEGYLKSTGNANNTAFNVSGRAVPDVSALSAMPFVWQGIINDGGSTSFSAAIFASIVALLTNERIAAGKPGLGFLNPFLYQNPQAFQDVVVGNNAACSTEFAFNATAGWDPATGFGSPIFSKLLQIVNGL